MNILALQKRVNRTVLASFGVPVILGDREVHAEYLSPSTLSMLDGVTAVSNQPQIVVSDDDLPLEPVGATVLIGAPHFQMEARFEVVDARPDGRGMTTLMLEVPR